MELSAVRLPLPLFALRRRSGPATTPEPVCVAVGDIEGSVNCLAVFTSTDAIARFVSQSLPGMPLRLLELQTLARGADVEQWLESIGECDATHLAIDPVAVGQVQIIPLDNFRRSAGSAARFREN